jgi:hypothetical protein
MKLYTMIKERRCTGEAQTSKEILVSVILVGILQDIQRHNIWAILNYSLERLLLWATLNRGLEKRLLCVTPVVVLQQVSEMAQQAKSIDEIHSYGVPYEVIFEALDYALIHGFITDVRYATLIDQFNNSVIVYTILIVGALGAVGVGVYYLIKYLKSRPPSSSDSSGSEMSVRDTPKDSSSTSTSEPSKYVSQLIAAFPFKIQALLLGSLTVIIGLSILAFEITLLSC